MREVLFVAMDRSGRDWQPERNEESFGPGINPALEPVNLGRPFCPRCAFKDDPHLHGSKLFDHGKELY